MMISGASGGRGHPFLKFLDIRIAMQITPLNAIFYEETADSKALSKS
jgi:hypothetical protein